MTFDATTGTPVRVAESLPSSLIYADKRFYCLTEQGTMTLQELTDKGFRTTVVFNLLKGRTSGPIRLSAKADSSFAITTTFIVMTSGTRNW